MSSVIDDAKGPDGAWVASQTTTGGRRFTRAWVYFNGMRARCRTGSAAQAQRPTYAGCVNAFASFQEFADWATAQPGYGKDGWSIDKDLLIKGNKVYSKETCVFVPLEINNALTNRRRHRGPFPIGVCKDSEGKNPLYRAYINENGKSKRIGAFKTVEQAFQAYKVEKEAALHRLAEKYKEQIDIRAFEALMSYQIEITD